MEDKEERILISGLRKYKGDAYKLTMFGDKDVVPVERVWQMCMTRQEAIEVMAKAMFVILPRFSNLEYEILACEILAKEALNALLEGVKK